MNQKFVFFNMFDQDLSALNPSIWAQESLVVLDETCMMLPLVNRQYDATEIKKQGDVVKAFRPGDFEAKRKTVSDEISTQDAGVTEVDVRLDFHLYSSFIIRDGEESMSFWELRNRYLGRALQSLAQEADELVANMKYYFYANMVGKLGTALTSTSLIDAALKLNLANAPMDERYFVMTPQQQADLQAVQLFTDASQVGDDGTALRMGSLGYKYGIGNVMSQNMRAVPTGSTAVTGAVNNSGGYAAGTTTLVVDGFSGKLTAGSWCTIAGDARPRRISSATGSPNTTGIVLEKAIDYAVADNAVITVYTPGAIDLAAGYAQYYTKELTVDGFSVAPKQGQLASLTTSDKPYGVVGTASTTALKLNRSLGAAAVDDQALALGPAGDYGFAFHRDAVGFISRPLALPMDGVGVQAAIADNGNMGVRVTIAYDYKKQGHVVTVDMLCGLAALNDNLGVLVIR
jgi:hypothetical protein